MRAIVIHRLVPPDGLPVTVDEFIDHARLNGITVGRQPDLIDRELSSATRRAELFLRRSLLTQTLQATFVHDDVRCSASRALVLPRGHVQSVTSVTASDGTVFDPVTGYTVEGNVILLASPLYQQAATAVWVSGYGDAPADVPDTIREGILEYATVLYGDRSGDRPAKWMATAGKGVPAGIRDLWRSEQLELSG